MATTPLTLVEADRLGDAILTTGTAADTTNNNSFSNDGNVVLIVKNTGASSYTVSVNIIDLVDGQTPTAKQITVAASAIVAFGPFPVAYYGNNPTIVSQNAAITLIPLHITRNG